MSQSSETQSSPATSSQHQHEGSLDPINLPRDITDVIYLYDPLSAINLEPSRRSHIVRLITGWRPPEDISFTILEAIGREDFEILADTPELFPYLRSHFREDVSIWIAILMQKVSHAALNELITLGVVKKRRRRKSGKLHLFEPSLYSYLQRVCKRGEIDTIRELDLFDYAMDNLGDLLSVALLHTDSISVAKELLLILKAKGWSIETIFENLHISVAYPETKDYHKESDPPPALLLEMIDIAKDVDTQLREIMQWCVVYECSSTVRYLRERFDIAVDSYFDELPFDMMVETLLKDREIHVIGSAVRTAAISNLPYHEDRRKIDLLLEALKVPSFWPDEKESVDSGEDAAYSVYRTKKRVRKLLQDRLDPLLNRYRPKMLESLISEGDGHIFEGFIPGNITKYIQGDNRLLPQIRVAILRGFRCEEDYPWIKRI